MALTSPHCTMFVGTPLGAIKRAIAIWVGATLPAAPSVRKQKSIAFSMLLPKTNLAIAFGDPFCNLAGTKSRKAFFVKR